MTNPFEDQAGLDRLLHEPVGGLTRTTAMPIEARTMVPLQVERVRRISELLLSPPYLAFAWVGYGLTPAQHIFRFGNTAYLIGIALCALAALLAIHVLRRGRFALLLDERLSSPLEHRLRMVLLAPLFIFYGIALLEVWMERPYGRGALALLLIPVLVFVGWRPWRSSWWPRVALMAVCGAGAVALLWHPPLERRLEHVQLLLLGCAALANVIDQCELYLLLGQGGQAEAEADGRPV